MRLVLDRIEKIENGKRVAVFECENTMLSICEENMPPKFIDDLKSGMILESEVENNTLISPVILYEETENKQKEIKKRLNNLFNRKK